jgi:protoporphyrinogen oxidase
MDSVRYLVVGAGVTGLSFANWIGAETDLLILEADAEPGGYCKTIVQDGFVWDYSGHFFHFRHADIEAWLRERMPGADVRTVAKKSLIRFRGVDVDFPFQKNIHQLPRAELIDCVHDLYFKADHYGTGEPESFQQMLYQRFGKSIAEYFLIPYNEKLYACSLDTLDTDAMGRFFPHADTADIIRNMRAPDNRTYNATFTYPSGGAIEYIRALLHDVPDTAVSYREKLVGIDLARKVATTSRREIGYEHLISSAPLNRLAAAADIEHDPAVFNWNKVLVFNLGFDRKGRDDVHWMYFPERDVSFYRVGWYDNIIPSDRMSLYIEIGADRNATFDIDAQRQRVLADLAKAGITGRHNLVSWHSVVLDPAYVHITKASLAEHARLAPILEAGGVHTAGRYGGWTYCSIEDTMVETRQLANKLRGG